MSSLSKLRELFESNNIDVYIVPTSDAHQSEYVPEFALRRSFISGFTGSAGTAVITKDKALLWTDGRYFLQAGEQLSDEWILMKDRLPETPSIQQWILNEFPADKTEKTIRVGIDPSLHSISQCKDSENLWKKNLSKKTDKPFIEFAEIKENLVDKIWTNQPLPPKSKAFVLDEKYTGVSVVQKLKELKETVAKQSDAIVISALDEVVWLLNIRGSDIEFNPVVIGYVIVDANNDNTTFFVDESKLDEKVQKHLEKANVKTSSYESFFDTLSKRTDRVWLDDSTTSRATESCVAEERRYIAPSPIQLSKAIKNEAELNGARACHIRDAVAVCQFLQWLEATPTDKLPTEIGASDWLDKARSKQNDFVSLSFDTISGANAHGAIIHYKASADSDAPLTDGMYLCDSGGQYLDGTTDITRTVHLGKPSDHERRCYTRVLQGHVDLGLATFPKGISGGQLDIVARLPLFADGLDYRHGTGHGVGAFLNVHEGPHGISSRPYSLKTSLQPGMIVTNEPGYYEDGAFGIRIENCMVVVEKQTKHNFGGLPYYGFEHITLVPYAKNLTDLSMLTKEQIAFVNEYHAECRAKVGPLLKEQDKAAYEWLIKNTEPW